MTKKNDTIMIICAHPDDEILGCGGTIAKYSQEKKEIITVIFSYGEESHPWFKEDKIKKIRIKESKNAGKIVGTKKTIFLGVADGNFKKDIKNNPNYEKELEKIIKKYKPDKIFTHSFDDIIFYDHKATHDLTLKVIKNIKYKGEIYTFNIWNPTNIRKRNSSKLVVDISKTFHKKIKALKSFKSQKVALVQLTPVVYIRAIFHGLNKGFKFAEIFYKIK